jgi:hypothetical protein
MRRRMKMRKTHERMLRAEEENIAALALLVRMLMALFRRSLSLRTSLQQSIRPATCLRGNAESNSRSSPFYRPRAPSCVTLSLVPRGRGITCLRGCGLRPSAILKSSKSLSCFRRRWLLSWSRCLGARPVTPSAWW